MPAAAPSRSTSSLTISWGLVNVPVACYSGKEDFGVKRSEYTAEGHKVGRKQFDKETGADVAYSDIVKMFEVDGQIVPLSDDEIDAIIQPVKGVAEVRAFVPLAHLVAGTYLPDGVMQIRPANEKSGKVKRPNPATEKAFALLMEAMKAEGVFALVHLAQRGKPVYAAILPDGRMLTLLHDEQVRAPLPMPDLVLSDAEVEMGRRLISALREDDAPVLCDEATVKVQEYAQAKVAGGKGFVPAEATEPVAAADDLLAVLEASLKKAAA